MINTELAKITHTTVADQSARYPISFNYDVLPDTLAPELLVTLDGNPLTYGTDYTVDAAGLQLVNAPEANKTLVIKRDVAFTQDIDFQTGFIDPDQIEDGFDRSVMRDQELKQNVLDVAAALAAETEERTTADTLLQDAIDDEAEARSLADTTLQNNIDAEADAREDADDALQVAINTKQDIIADLATIRSGAAAGATAVQPGDLATVATSGSYNDLSNRPTIPATAADVHALPDTTKYGASLALSVNPTTFVVTAQLKDQDGNNIGTAQTIDLPLESVVVSGTYDAATKEVVLTLESGSTIRFSVADLVSGLQTEITSVNMLDADLVDDTSSVHKFVTAADKISWDNKVSKSGDTMTGVLNLQNDVDNVSAATQIVMYARLNGSVGMPNTISTLLSGGFTFSAGASFNGPLTARNNQNDLGASLLKWRTLYVTKINNGADITVPASGGTMARVEDLPDVSHMVTDNTAQSITAVKTLVSASASNTTPQVILANYAVKFGTSDNNDLFSISANANTSTLSIVGDNASNIIDIAASGAVLNHLQVTSSDVTFGGNSLINPGVMTGADGTNAGTSGLVPAPAATDNDKFLAGDGTWKAAGGGSTYTAGNGISIDANNEISVADPVLMNGASDSTAIAIGSSNNYVRSVAIGSAATVTGNWSVAVGPTCTAASDSIAIGQATLANSATYNIAITTTGINIYGKRNICIGGFNTGVLNTNHSIFLGYVALNSFDSESLYVGFSRGDTTKTHKLLSADGTVPADRLASTTGLTDGNYRLRLVMASGVPTLEWVAE